jgi:hypothetical protein
MPPAKPRSSRLAPRSKAVALTQPTNTLGSSTLPAASLRLKIVSPPP